MTETYPPEVNGVSLTVGHLVEGLRARGHAVSLVRPRQAPRDEGERHADAVTLVRGVPLAGYPSVRMGLPAGALLASQWSERRPDVLYVATEGPLGWSAARTASRMGIRVVSGFHTNFHGYAKHYRLGWLSAPIARYLRKFHNRTDLTLVPTLDIRERLAAAGFQKLDVLGRGVDTQLFTPERRCTTLRRAWGAGDDDLVVLYVGRVAAEKNIALALAAYRAMRQVTARLRFVIVGDGPLRAALEAAHSDVVFCGVRVHETLAAHYASADVFLFPSETETFGNVILEALASGLIVVAYDYAAARAHVRHAETGWLASYADSAAFVGYAVTLARTPQALDLLRRRARQSVLPFAWTRVVDRFEMLLTEPRGGTLS